MRLFISIDPPEALQQQIASRCPRLKGLRYPAMRQLHLTLLFLGELQSNDYTAVTDAVEPVSAPPFELQLSGIGQFNSGVIWLGVAPCQALFRLQRRLSIALQPILQQRQRRYHPHLTLARSRRPVSDQQYSAFSAAFADTGFTFTVNTFLLKQSSLRPEGALHQVIGEWQLGA